MACILAHFVFNGAVVLVYLNPKYATMEPQYNIWIDRGQYIYIVVAILDEAYISYPLCGGI
jgi:hypothetical protein